MSEGEYFQMHFIATIHTLEWLKLKELMILNASEDGSN